MKKIFPRIVDTRKRKLRISRSLYFYTRWPESRAQPNCVLHVRITRNDRPGWLPLTGRAPARFYAFHPPNYAGQCGGRGGVLRFLHDLSTFRSNERTNEPGPCPPLVRRFVGEGEIERNETEVEKCCVFRIRNYGFCCVFIENRWVIDRLIGILRIDPRVRLTFSLVSLVILDFLINNISSVGIDRRTIS